MTGLQLSIQLRREDSIPAFAGFLRCEAQHENSAEIIMNVQACMSPVLSDENGADVPMTRDDRKRLIIESLMHEFGHALELHFRLPVNEEAIEKVCMAWESAYKNSVLPDPE